MANPQRKRTRHVQRLSPVTLMSRASEEGLDTLASEVLAPHFHQEPVERRKVRFSSDQEAFYDTHAVSNSLQFDRHYEITRS